VSVPYKIEMTWKDKDQILPTYVTLEGVKDITAVCERNAQTGAMRLILSGTTRDPEPAP
jgi:hypothetical protein